MIVNLTKNIITGNANNTVLYSIENLRFDSVDNKLKWDEFKFYSPNGNYVDDGFQYLDSKTGENATKSVKYFNVAAGEYLIQRHASLNKIFLIKMAASTGVEIIEIMEGSSFPTIEIDKDGDITIYGEITSDINDDVNISYKEVQHVEN